MKTNLAVNLRKKIRVVKDFPKEGILFQDITSITDDAKLLNKVVKSISQYVKKNKFTKIAAVEARGFIFGTAIAYECNIPLVPIRKKGKLPGNVLRQKYRKTSFRSRIFAVANRPKRVLAKFDANRSYVRGVEAVRSFLSAAATALQNYEAPLVGARHNEEVATNEAMVLSNSSFEIFLSPSASKFTSRCAWVGRPCPRACTVRSLIIVQC